MSKVVVKILVVIVCIVGIVFFILSKQYKDKNLIVVDNDVMTMLRFMQLDDCGISELGDYKQFIGEYLLDIDVMISDAEIKEYINNELYVRAEYIVDEMIKKVNGECIVYLECIVYDEKNNIILEEKNYMDMKELCLSNIELYNA